MELRKIQRTQGGTFFVCLPKGWAEKTGLTRGSVVALEETSDGRLVIDPKYEVEKAPQEIVIKPSPFLDREIIGKYLLGYDVIRIESKERINPEDRERVKRAARRLVGLEIVEEDYARIVLQCLLEPSSLPPEKVLKREYSIAASMHRDAVTAFIDDDEHLARNVIARDDEVNRLYFLLVRVLRTVIQNPSLGEKLGIRPIDCLDYRLTGSLVESIGDQSVQIATKVAAYKGGKINSNVKKLVSDLHVTVYEAHETAIKALSTHSISIAESVREIQPKVIKINEEIERVVGEKENSQYILAVVSHINRIYEHSVDIADLVIPRLSA